MENSTTARRSWLVTETWRTFAALVLVVVIGAALVAVIGPFCAHLGVPPWVVTAAQVVLILLFFLGLKAVFRGGCSVDSESRQLTRWWGLFIPIRSRVIPFAEIRSIHLSFGIFPHGVRAARERHVWYNLAAEIDGRYLLLKAEKNYDRAKEFGEALASLFDTSLLDYTT